MSGPTVDAPQPRPPAGARAAAFGSTPDIPRGVRDPEDRWLVAVALGGLGHYAAAAAELERLAGDPTVPLRVAAHAAVTRAAHLRQLGGHAAARAYDARGLRLAMAALRRERPPDHQLGAHPVGDGRPVRPADDHPNGADPDVTPDDGLDAAAARIDALVGLAADAVGLGDPATARRLLDRAAPALAAHSSWRPGVRAGWVRAELALVLGRPTEAVPPAEAALRGARRGGSARHVLKSRIVLAVAAGAAGTLDAPSAVAELDAAAAECAAAGLLPLVWPAALAADDLRLRINDQVASMTGSAPGGRSRGTTRRRHAARAALSDIEQRSDPLGKRQMGESVWIPQPATLV